jgi:hypothetical protein
MTTTQEPQKSENKQPVNNYITDKSDIPEYIKISTKSELGTKDQAGNEKSPNLVTPKEAGSYYGKVATTDGKYIVQSVGKDNKTAVLHKVEHLDFQGANLKNLAEGNRLKDKPVQIHYGKDSDGKIVGKVYPYKEKEQQSVNTSITKEALKDTVKAAIQGNTKEFFAKAKELAESTIGNTKQRESFLKKLGAATELNLKPESKEKSSTDKSVSPKTTIKSAQKDKPAADLER